jgi:hypothetical protein
MPSADLRAIAYYIADTWKQHAAETWIPLVGGFLMLRFFAFIQFQDSCLSG